MMRAEYSISWTFNTKIILTAAWLFPPSDVIQREVAFAANRKQVDINSVEVVISPGMRRQALHMLHMAIHGNPEALPKHAVAGVGDPTSAKPDADGSWGELVDGPSLSARVKALINAVHPLSDGKVAKLQEGSPGWQRRLMRTGRVRVTDLVIAIQTACTKDPVLKPVAFLPKAFALAMPLLAFPFILQASHGALSTTSLGTWIHVLLAIGSFFNAGSMMAFYYMSIFDYTRRAAAQRVLTELVRGQFRDQVQAGMNTFFPFAAQRLDEARYDETKQSSQQALNRQLRSLVGVKLPTVEEEASDEEESDDASDSPEQDCTPGAVLVQTSEADASVALDPALPPSGSQSAHAAEGKVGHPQHSGPRSRARAWSSESGSALRVLAGESPQKKDSLLPPFIDPTVPANVFAWMHLRELLVDLGLRFQLRMQVLVGITVVYAIIMDTFAISRIFGSNEPWGEFLEYDFIMISSVVHSLLAFSVLFVCVAVASFANKQAERQAEALSYAQIELEEFVANAQLVLQGKGGSSLKGRKSERSESDVSLQTRRRPGTAWGAAQQSAPRASFSSLDSELEAPSEVRSGSNARPRSSSRTALHGRLAAMPPKDIEAAVASSRHAIESLVTAIDGLAIRNVANPLRVMGLPASYPLLRLMLTAAAYAAVMVIGQVLA